MKIKKISIEEPSEFRYKFIKKNKPKPVKTVCKISIDEDEPDEKPCFDINHSQRMPITLEEDLQRLLSLKIVPHNARALYKMYDYHVMEDMCAELQYVDSSGVKRICKTNFILAKIINLDERPFFLSISNNIDTRRSYADTCICIPLIYFNGDSTPFNRIFIHGLEYDKVFLNPQDMISFGNKPDDGIIGAIPASAKMSFFVGKSTYVPFATELEYLEEANYKWYSFIDYRKGIVSDWMILHCQFESGSTIYRELSKC